MPSDDSGNPSKVGGEPGKRKVATHYWQAVKDAGAAGNPFQPLKLEHAKGAMDAANKAICAVTVLKNIVSIFVSIGKRFGGDELLSKCPMSPAQIYKNLAEYTYVSSYTNMNNSIVVSDNYKIIMRGSVNSQITDDHHFGQDDEYFKMMLQAMVAKVLTAVGTYVMLNKPAMASEKTDKPTAAIRQIIGGYEHLPDVNPDAADLYIRLPLLMEWYRELHDVHGEHPAGNRITLIPEFDNVWSGLVNLVYDTARNVNHGTYSDAQTRDIIREVNDIFRKYKAVAPKDTSREVILGLVTEMNRRYGIYCQEEVKSWLDSRRYKKQGKSQSPGEATNFDILPNEDEPDYPRPSPSDRYVELSAESKQRG